MPLLLAQSANAYSTIQQANLTELAKFGSSREKLDIFRRPKNKIRFSRWEHFKYFFDVLSCDSYTNHVPKSPTLSLDKNFVMASKTCVC